MALKQPTPMKRITFQEENMDFQAAIKKASEWANANKNKIVIDSSSYGCVYDKKHNKATGEHRYARAVIIRYKDK